MTPAYRPTLRAFRPFVQALHLPWSKPQRENLVRLGTAFCRERSLPLRRLARGLAGPGAAQRAADSASRFLGNEKVEVGGALPALLRFVLARFDAVSCGPVMLGWTFIGTTHALLWAQIPYRGRSFPLLCRVYPYAELNATAHELALLAAVAAAWPAATPRPLLLADRGFPKRELLTWCAAHGWYFLIRAKSSLAVHDAAGRRCDPDQVPAGKPQTFPHATVLGQEPGPVHVVAHRPLDARQRGARWLLGTNLPEEWLPEAARLYRHRMQPEQTHRDCKRGPFLAGFALSHLQKLRADRWERLVFCLGLAYAFLNLRAETAREGREWGQRRHWGLSLITYALDLLACWRPRLPKTIRRVLREVRWLPLWFPAASVPTPARSRSNACYRFSPS